MNLRWKTHGGVSPDRRVKLFVVLYSQIDLPLVEKISQEILTEFDIALYFPEVPEEMSRCPDCSFLDSMELVIFPVTRNAIREDGTIRDEIFTEAAKRFIPILPILYDSDLENLINQTGFLWQYLDPNSNDLAHKSFHEKLTDYLSSILLDDETVLKIRAAFEAFVFLSYRKKDRETARKLMKLIHNYDFARDIGIWYDEFLTPGEDFSQEIFENLAESDLVIMVLTPSLEEDPNYIAEKEYPASIAQNKPILAVEMKSTDHQKIEKMYPGLKEIIPVTDQQWAVYLKDILHKKKGTMVQNTDPLHLFFIGLAYLKGIGAEKNQKRGFMLIEKSAQLGIIQSALKLAQMYEVGDGVACSQEKCFEWLKRAGNLANHSYKADPSQENRNQLIQICRLLMGKLLNQLLVGEFEETEAVISSILENLKSNGSEELGLTAEFYFLKGNIFKNRGCLQEAIRKLLETVWLIVENEKQGLNEANDYQTQLAAKQMLARIYLEIGEKNESSRHAEDIIKFLELNRDEFNSRTFRQFYLAASQLQIFCMDRKTEDGSEDRLVEKLRSDHLLWSTAEEEKTTNRWLFLSLQAELAIRSRNNIKALELLQNIREEVLESWKQTRSNLYLRNAATICSRIADCLFSLNRKRESLEEYGKAISLTLELRSLTSDDHQLLVDCFLQKSEAERKLGDTAAARLEGQKAYSILQELPETPTKLTALWNFFRTMGLIAEMEKDYFGAILCFQKQLIITKKQNLDHLERIRTESTIFSDLGRSYLYLQDWKNAEFYIKLADQKLEDLEYKEFLPSVQKQRMTSVRNLGTLNYRIGNFNAAVEYYLKSLEIYDSIIFKDYDRAEQLNSKAEILEGLSTSFFQLENLEEELKYREQMCQVMAELSEIEDSDFDNEKYFHALCILGITYWDDKDDWNKAADCFFRAEDIFNRQKIEAGKSNLSDMAALKSKLSNYLMTKGRYREAEVKLKDALKFLDEADQSLDGVETVYKRLYYLWQIGWLYYQQEKYEEASRFLDDSVRLTHQYSNRFEWCSDWANYAVTCQYLALTFIFLNKEELISELITNFTDCFILQGKQEFLQDSELILEINSLFSEVISSLKSKRSFEVENLIRIEQIRLYEKAAAFTCSEKVILGLINECNLAIKEYKRKDTDLYREYLQKKLNALVRLEDLDSKAENKMSIVELYREMARNYRDQGDFSTALELFKKAVAGGEKLYNQNGGRYFDGFRNWIFSVLEAAECAESLGMEQKADFLYEEALNLGSIVDDARPEKWEEKRCSLIAKHEAGSWKAIQNQPLEAIEILKKAAEGYEILADERRVRMIYHECWSTCYQLAKIFAEQRQYKESHLYLQKSIDACKKSIELKRFIEQAEEDLKKSMILSASLND